MATTQLIETEQLCPTQTQSLIMIRNLLRTAISTIVYIRGLFPEDSFADKKMNGLSLKALKPSSPEAGTLIGWLEEGVFEALEKKYLKTIMFGIYTDPEQPNNLIECYKFMVNYSEDGSASLNFEGKKASEGIFTKEQIKKATFTLLRALTNLASNLNTLPEERYMTMKLLYFDYTPEEYQPKFFRESDAEPIMFEKRPEKINIGKVKTGYHSIDLKMATLAAVTNESSPDSDLKWEENVELEQEKTADSEEQIDQLFEKAASLLKEQKVKNPKKLLTAKFPDLSEETMKELIERLQNEGIITSADGVPQKVYLKALKTISEKTNDYLLRRDLPGVSSHILNKLMKKLEIEGRVEKISSKNLQKGRKILKKDISSDAEIEEEGPVKRNSILDFAPNKKRKQSATGDDISSQGKKKSKSNKEE